MGAYFQECTSLGEDVKKKLSEFQTGTSISSWLQCWGSGGRIMIYPDWQSAQLKWLPEKYKLSQTLLLLWWCSGTEHCHLHSKPGLAKQEKPAVMFTMCGSYTTYPYQVPATSHHSGGGRSHPEWQASYFPVTAAQEQAHSYISTPTAHSRQLYRGRVSLHTFHLNILPAGQGCKSARLNTGSWENCSVAGG